MEIDSGERRIVKSPLFARTSLPVQDKLKCPRCESNNTKFCYFNNYNLAQPRHYCKDCKRYWTHGGTLRNIPVGGGTRKNSHKRSSTNNNNNNDSPASHSSSPPTPPQPQQDPPIAIPAYPISSFPVIRTFNGAPGPGTVQCFPTPMNNVHTSGFMTYNGFGFDDLSVWPLSLPDAPETVNTGGGLGNGGGVVNAWQLGIGGDGGYGDNFSWPDLSISSTPRKSIK